MTDLAPRTADAATSTTLSADICVIGAGSGGLSVAAAAASFGQKVILIEKHKMGGDCLNYGCVPSKALLAAGKRAQAMRSAAKFGIMAVEPQIDYGAVHDHVQGVIAAIAPNDSVERFTGLGVRVIQAPGRFIDSRTVGAGDYRITARRFVIATGSSPFVPPIAGLESVPYFTNETIFDNTRRLDHLIVIGGGPIGLELAQAHRRLGCKVTVLEAATILPKDDPDAVAVVRARLAAEGVSIVEGAKVARVSGSGAGVAVAFSKDGRTETVDGSHLLVAAGRRPNVEDLGLEAAGVSVTAKGIAVDARLRTSNRSVYAIGDVAGGYQFTHIAGYHAGIVIRNVMFRVPARVDYRAVPWVTYVDPELAHVGQHLEDARKTDASASAVTWALVENDRAQAERETEGFIKAVVGRGGRVLGATIVGRNAGELLLPWVLAVQKRMRIRDMTDVIAPYPTLSEISKRVAGAYYTPTLFSDRTRRVVRLLRWLP